LRESSVHLLVSGSKANTLITCELQSFAISSNVVSTEERCHSVFPMALGGHFRKSDPCCGRSITCSLAIFACLEATRVYNVSFSSKEVGKGPYT